jgi:MinD-like ATPase involved in chromosome partitioning or flagellar assembly
MKTKRLIITAGAKGGSGKSLTTTILHAWLQSQKIRTVAIDGDNANSTLKRFLPESKYIDMRDQTEIDSILSPITDDEAEVVLLDSRAATSDEMVQWLKQIGVQAIKTDLSTSITVVIIVTSSRDTLEQLKWWKDQLGTSVQWLIVRNIVNEQVDEYDGSKLRLEMTATLKGREITLPKIPSFLIQALEQHTLTIHAATTDKALSWTNTRRFKEIEKDLFTQLETNKEILIP